MRAMKPRPGARLLPIRQASEETGLPSALLRDLVKRGELHAIQPPGIRRVFLERRELEAAIGRWQMGAL